MKLFGPRILIPAAVLAAVLLLVAGLVLLPARREARLLAARPLTVMHNLSGEAAGAVESQLRHYGDLHPDRRLRILPLPASPLPGEPEPDLVIARDGAGDKFLPARKTLLWTGDLWTLGVNTSVLGEKTADFTAKASAVTSTEELTSLLEEIRLAGIVPLAAGNSHGWPLALWDEHLSALNRKGQMEPPDSVFSRPGGTIPPSWTVLKDWRDRGFFLEEILEQGWARGIQAAAEGKAAMVLMAGNMAASIPRSLRDRFLFLPFPGSRIGAGWAVGSGISLSINTASPLPGETEALEEYLTSPGVTGLLEERTGLLFLSREETPAGTFLPSWVPLANTPEMRAYTDALKDYLRS